MTDLDYYTCHTLFDITPTAVNKNQLMPFRDAAEQTVDTPVSWERSRNQQRNWDTMKQIISMRAQPISLSLPKVVEIDDHLFAQCHCGTQRVWSFTFGVETREAFRKGNDLVWALHHDSNMVPMSVGLTETANLVPACVITDSLMLNTWFESVILPLNH
jgi:hypothetical protein